MTTFLLIIENIVLLGLMGVAFVFIATHRQSFGPLKTNILFGLCFGLTAAFVTVVPVQLLDGATVDARAGPIILSGIIAGPIGALIAATLGALARGFVGGSFAFSGMIVFFVYAIAGLLLRRSGWVTEKTLPRLSSVGIVALASMLGASLMFFLISPKHIGLRWLQMDLPYILIANVLSVGVATLCIGLAAAYIKKSTQLVELNDALSLAKRAGGFGVWDYDLATRILKWDERSRELHGVENESFHGTFEDWAANVHPDDLERATTAFREAIQNKSVFDCEYRVRLPDGRENRIKGDAIVICDANGSASRVVGSNIDLTDIRRTEENLVSAQSLAVQALKIETVGQLTGGIAHDFNNMLAVVLGNLELLTLKQKAGDLSGEEAKSLIESSIQAARRGSDLTKNMLAYARKARLKPSDVNLNDVVRQTQIWISRTIESSVDIQSDLEAEIWLTKVDESSLQSALVNLIVNARDAVAGAGRVTIQTANTMFDDSFVDDAGERLEAGAYVILSVEDDGVGMDESTQAKIFDPFYTTKAVGEGTGLGLSTVQGFVKQSRGAIRVESTRGVGTRFSLIFPALTTREPSVQDALDVDAELVPIADGAGTKILIVEDQADVRATLKDMLENAGYTVTTAKNGDEALAMCESSECIDLVLSDIVMPGTLQGNELATELRNRIPNLPVLLISGYDRAHDGGLPESATNQLPLEKPIHQSELLRAVQDALQGSKTKG